MALFNTISKRFFSKSLLLLKHCPLKREKPKVQTCPPIEKPKLPICPPPAHHECKAYPTPTEKTDCAKRIEKEHLKHEISALVFKLISLCICLPIIIGLSIKTFCYTDHHPKRDEYKDYSHMGIRVRPFPWGDGKHSLFHNPCYNPIPHEGYEDDMCDEEILHHITTEDDNEDSHDDGNVTPSETDSDGSENPEE